MKTSRYLYWIRALIYLGLAMFLISCGDWGRYSAGGRAQIKRGEEALYWALGSNQYPVVMRALYQLAQIRARENLSQLQLSAYIDQKGSFAHLPPAIIMDLDETVLDNTTHMAYLFRMGKRFELEMWGNYANSVVSGEVPGSVEFANWAVGQGIRVFFVTNRTENLRDATIKNLKKIGIDFPRMGEQTFFKAPEGKFGLADKYPRYNAIAKNHRIILIVGDNYSDFVNTEGLDANQYKAVFEQYTDYIGRCWIILPNPLYGDWEKIQGLSRTFPIWSNK